ncbi:MAG: GGDEF domain-containing protein [Rhodospirillaceae bacterium]|nr:GGDEF domain-containing protein [Rhodospirillaceae bacterium]
MAKPSFERENSAADAALRIIRTIATKPEPLNYAVWYTYCSGESLDLKAELDGYFKSKTPITTDISEAMFAKYIAPVLASMADQATRQKLDEANERLAKTLNSVMDLVASGSQGTESFSKALDKFKGEVQSSVDPKLAGAVAAMITETQKIASLNTELRTKLNSASGEIDALKGDLSAIRKEAYTDGLSGIPNRKAFNKEIDDLTFALKQKSGYLCLFMTDIDKFKSFNDTHGHLVGDQVIKVVANILAKNVRDTDFVARYGGEEFAALFPNTRLKDAIAVAEKVRQAVRGKEIQNRRTGESLGQITISIGVAEYAIGESIDDFISRADSALYLAKQMGRDRVCSQNDLTR